MKRIIALAVFILPLVVNAQTKLTASIADDFSDKVAARYLVRNDSLIVFVTEQVSRSGAGGLDIDKTMTELKKDPAALDAALKFVYQFSGCNRQQLIAHLRAMNLQSNSVFPLATYAVNTFKGEIKDLLEEKSALYASGAIPATLPPFTPPPVIAKIQEPGSEPSQTATDSNTSATVQEPGTVNSATTAEASATDSYNWDVRQIFKLRQPEQLFALYGKENVEARTATDLQGNESGTAYYVFPDTDNEMEVFFDGDNGTGITFTKEHSKWKSPFGIKVGDPLDKVVKVNGRNFRINGFEWDNGGMVASWDGGAIDGKGVSIVFKATNSGDPKLYDQVTGDKRIKTDLSAMKKLDVVIEKIAFKSN
jgi:hypothetical protein